MVSVISVQDFPYVCRICLMRTELKNFGEYLYLLDNFKNVVNIEIETNDGLPRNICFKCIYKLEDISEFFDLWRNNDIDLRQTLITATVLKDSIYGSNTEVEDTFDLKEIKIEEPQIQNNCDDSKRKSEENNFARKNFQSSYCQCENPKSSGKLECEVCKKEFATSALKDKHVDSHFGKIPVLCFMCGKWFIRKKEYLEHYRFHSLKWSTESCKDCKQNIRKRANVFDKSHIQVSRAKISDENCSIDAELSGDQKPIRNTFQCSICHIAYSSQLDLSKHWKLHGNPRKYQCTLCKRSYRFKCHLDKHMVVHSSDTPTFKCDICAKVFPKKSNLKKHFLRHMKEKQFKCEVCPKSFVSKYNLRDHIRTHTKEKPFECSVCSKKCSQKTDLKIHMRIHTGERPFKCTECSKSFSQRGHLSIHHKMVHVREKSFSCPLCPMKFCRNCEVTKHLKIHYGVKPFECQFCLTKYSRKAQLEAHIRRRKSDVPFQCPECDMKICLENSYKIHINTHGEPKSNRKRKLKISSELDKASEVSESVS